KPIDALVPQLKSIMSVELNAGQMVEDVRLVANGRVPVGFYGRQGGVVPNPDEIYEAFLKFIK
ncbi:MAG: 3-methyl-2-oxobutanoate dehydrogenase subunit beta, partial [Bacteroidales bacterium]|nr:3-methyl-2-oxobutanoate dehydrogenase subunit beta [Bacteroidales bacterium]